MSKGNTEKDTGLFDFLDYLIGSVIVIQFIVVLTLIWIPFQNSIRHAFSPMIYSSLEMVTAVETAEKIEGGIHLKTGLVYDQNFEWVRQKCLSCHSSKLITQNRASREGWKETIDWMYQTQGLVDLGKYEVKILDYLVTNYGPEKKGRRIYLDPEEIDWYVLEEEY